MDLDPPVKCLDPDPVSGEFWYKTLFWCVLFAELHRNWLVDITLRLISLIALDKFADFISDQVWGTSIWLFKTIWRLSEGGWRSLTQCFGSGSSPDPAQNQGDQNFTAEKRYFFISKIASYLSQVLRQLFALIIFFLTDLHGRIRIWTRLVIIAQQSYK